MRKDPIKLCEDWFCGLKESGRKKPKGRGVRQESTRKKSEIMVVTGKVARKTCLLVQGDCS